MYREPDFSKPSLAHAPECRFEPAPADTVLPDGFMSTTNHPTYVKVGGRWRMPERPRMDSHLVWDPASERLLVKEFRLVRKGDLVAVATAEDGSEGVLVWDRGFLDEVGRHARRRGVRVHVLRGEPREAGQLRRHLPRVR